jgi:gp16 family phage-associated protein
MSELGLTNANKGRAAGKGPCLSAEQAKAKVYEKGMTLKEFAQRHGLAYRTVSEVIRGVNKGLFGEGHKAAVALGMKRG